MEKNKKNSSQKIKTKNQGKKIKINRGRGNLTDRHPCHSGSPSTRPIRPSRQTRLRPDKLMTSATTDRVASQVSGSKTIQAQHHPLVHIRTWMLDTYMYITYALPTEYIHGSPKAWNPRRMCAYYESSLSTLSAPCAGGWQEIDRQDSASGDNAGIVCYRHGVSVILLSSCEVDVSSMSVDQYQAWLDLYCRCSCCWV